MCSVAHDYAAVAVTSRALPACWDSNATVNALLPCYTFDGRQKPHCVSVGYMQTAYIVQCLGSYALDNHCGTFLELHKPNDETILAQTRLFAEFTNGYRTTTLPLFHAGNRSRTVCNGDYEVIWWVLRTRYKYVVKYQKKLYITTPLCEFDDVTNDYRCAYCEHWFHGVCVQLSEEKAFAIAKFACPACTNKGCQTKYVADPKPSLDPSLLPLPRQFASLNIKQVLAGPSPSSVDKASAKFHQMLECGIVTAAFIHANGFHEPIVTDDSMGAVPGLRVPDSSIHVDDLPNILAAAKLIKTIDLSSQVPRQLTYTDVTSICNDGDSWCGNVEFPVIDTPLEYQISPPQLVLDLDWFQSSRAEIGGASFNPNTYIAMYSAHSFKDFCMSPNGSSTWLHHLYGPALTVYLVPPTPSHVDKFIEWCVSPARAAVHFADLTDKCIKIDVLPSSSLLIPASWMYSLYVPATATAMTTTGPETNVASTLQSSPSPPPQHPPSTAAVFLTGYFFHGFSMKDQVRVLEVEQTVARKASATGACVRVVYGEREKTNHDDMHVGRPPMWPMVTSAAQFPAPSPEMLKTWVWPAVQRFIGRLKRLQVLTEWETLGLLHILPLLRHCDLPNQGDSTVDALQALLGVKDPSLGGASTPVATSMASKGKAKKATTPSSQLSSMGPPHPPHGAPPSSSLVAASDSFLKQRDKKVCKCHLKKCVNCRNCTKRHCICGTPPPPLSTSLLVGGGLVGGGGVNLPSKKATLVLGDKKAKKKPPPTPATTIESTSTGPPMALSAVPYRPPPQLALQHTDTAQSLPPSGGALAPWATDDDPHDASSMWDHDMHQSFFSATELGLNMPGALELDDAFGIIDMVESSSLFSGYPPHPPPHPDAARVSPTAIKREYDGEEGGGGGGSTSSFSAPPPSSAQLGGGLHPHSSFLFDPTSAASADLYDSEKEGVKDFGDMTPDGDGSQRHRASCHRCGNLRKKNVRCLGCAEKMVEEHGPQTFIGGCPFHCYKKCPATKRCNLLSDEAMKLRGDDADSFKDDDMLMEFNIHDDDLDGSDIMAMPPSLADNPYHVPPHPSSSLSECDFDMDLGDLE
ncbi:hypothetical protein DYB30_004180 [Aphanomyces astaci]|uniref:JmjC domain-containing protein n=1 Tax=Aphanomyces astaci TaxID=112090 RepID=A0A397E3L0_APHAT|nr:hypothetical protein DYB30_004180 [Aphanomyces astaci]RHZ42147.1 hypothetical protein DYB26_011034 [Aphanomyces astaci]